MYKAKNRETDEIIALKKLRFGFDDQGLPSSTLREISLLKELKHDTIVECVFRGAPPLARGHRAACLALR